MLNRSAPRGKETHLIEEVEESINAEVRAPQHAAIGEMNRDGGSAHVHDGAAMVHRIALREGVQVVTSASPQR